VVLKDIRAHKRLVEEEMDLFGLEFINLDFCGLEQCHPSTRSDYLVRLPEMHEATTSLILWGTNISTHAIDMESEEGEEPVPSMTVAQLPPMSSMPILATRGDLLTNSTLVVRVPHKSPSCPCCTNQLGKMLGLIDNLKRAHGR